MINKNLDSLKKLKFYDRCFFIPLILFSFLFIFLFIIPEALLENTIFLIIWLPLFFICIILEMSFIIGMVYHSYKNKKYGWMILIIILGIIFPIIFYFSYLRKEFKEGRGIYKNNITQ